MKIENNSTRSKIAQSFRCISKGNM